MCIPFQSADSVYAVNNMKSDKDAEASRGYVYTYNIGDCGYAKYMSVYNDERGGGSRTDTRYTLRHVSLICENMKYTSHFRVSLKADAEEINAYLSEYKKELNEVSRMGRQALETYLDKLVEEDVLSLYTCIDEEKYKEFSASLNNELN